MGKKKSKVKPEVDDGIVSAQVMEVTEQESNEIDNISVLEPETDDPKPRDSSKSMMSGATKDIQDAHAKVKKQLGVHSKESKESLVDVSASWVTGDQDAADEPAQDGASTKTKKTKGSSKGSKKGKKKEEEGDDQGSTHPPDIDEMSVLSAEGAEEKAEKPRFGECACCLELSGEYRHWLDVYMCKHCYEVGVNNGTVKREVIKVDPRDLVSKAHSKKSNVSIIDENEECRKCLAHGFRRRCCNEYYCNACFFERGACPGCGKPCTTRGIGGGFEDVGTTWVLVGWLWSLSIVLFWIGVFIVLVVSDHMNPRTLLGHRCYGLYPQCSRFRCVDLGASVEQGIQDQATWEACSLKSENKMYGNTCLFDRYLYLQSDKQLGYDFCNGHVAKDQDKAWDGKEFDGSDFNGGVFVFEDTFDEWRNLSKFKSNVEWNFADEDTPNCLMKSAKWDVIYNAIPARTCGAFVDDKHPSLDTREPVSPDKRAFYFSGTDHRYAITLPLDVNNGGYVNFRLKTGPYGGGGTPAGCATAFQGSITIAFSVDDGFTWLDLSSYTAVFYRGENFQQVSATLPPEACTNFTRFKFYQTDFEQQHDHFAIDDLRIFHKFPKGWQKSESFAAVKTQAKKDMGVASCCYETGKCQEPGVRADRAGTNEVSSENFPGCGDVQNYKDNDGAEYKFYVNGARLFLVLASVLYLLTSLYADYIIPCCKGGPLQLLPQQCRCKKKKVFAVDEEIDLEDFIFGIDSDNVWKYSYFASMLFLHVLFAFWAWGELEDITLYQPLDIFMHTSAEKHHRLEVHNFWFFIMACFMDLKEFWYVTRHVVCVAPWFVPHVQADLRPSVNCIFIGDEDYTISLEDVQDIYRFSETDSRWFAANYVFMTVPWCLLSLILDNQNMDYRTNYYLSRLLAAIIVGRVFFGVDVGIKMAFAANWVIKTDNSSREEIAAALASRKTSSHIFWGSIYVGGLTALASFAGFENTELIYTVSAVGVIVGAAWGLIMAWWQSLPLTPHFKLTCLREGMFIRYYHKARCPCRGCCKLCSPMHSHDGMLILYCEDEPRLTQVLKGEQLTD